MTVERKLGLGARSSVRDCKIHRNDGFKLAPFSVPLHIDTHIFALAVFTAEVAPGMYFLHLYSKTFWALDRSRTYTDILSVHSNVISRHG